MATIDRASDAVDGVMALVETIPTVFGRLVYLATISETSARGYRSGPRIGTARSQQVGVTLGHAHTDVFARWLVLGLEQQRRDLMRFVDSDGRDAYECLRSWRTGGIFDQLAPETASWHETRLFRDDLELVIESLVGDSSE
jgi:hypothetical protein